MTAKRLTLTLRMVNHDAVNKVYYVVELHENGSIEQVSKEYTHSTSAFAALGRLFQQEIKNSNPRQK